jgi:hypothetical protein
MSGIGHFHRQRGSEIVSFIEIGDPATHADCLEGLLDNGHLRLQIIRHRWAARFVIGQQLMPPARVTIVAIEYRHDVRRLRVA